MSTSSVLTFAGSTWLGSSGFGSIGFGSTGSGLAETERCGGRPDAAEDSPYDAERAQSEVETCVSAPRSRWNGADRAKGCGWSSGLKLVLGDDDCSLVEKSAWDLQVRHCRGVNHPEVPRLGHDPCRGFELSELMP